MSERKSIEVTADTVDEAIASGLRQLDAAPSDVMVEVLEEPSRGVFGIGARPARVRLVLLRAAPPPAPPAPSASVTVSEPIAAPTAPMEYAPRDPDMVTPPREDRRDRGGRGGGGGRRGDRPREGGRDGRRGGRGGETRAEGGRKPPPPPADYDFPEDDDLLAFIGAEMVDLEGEAAEEAQITRTVLVELLLQMGVRGFEVTVSRAEGDQNEEAPLLLNVEGSDLDYLVGRRGEALSSLQYITRLIASRRLQRRANVVVDVGGYKLRRSQRLRELAIRMAEQAVEQARIIYMEPMPPHERRMIHMALRNHPDVITKSTGEGDARKVTIVPK